MAYDVVLKDMVGNPVTYGQDSIIGIKQIGMKDSTGKNRIFTDLTTMALYYVEQVSNTKVKIASKWFFDKKPNYLLGNGGLADESSGNPYMLLFTTDQTYNVGDIIDLNEIGGAE